MSEFDASLTDPSHIQDDEVDLTNLADPLLVLSAMLILTWQTLAVVATNLVDGSGAPVAAEAREGVSISLMADGRVFWNREPIELRQIGRRLDQLKGRPSGQTITLAGERDCRYGASLIVKSEAVKRGLKVKEVIRPTKG